MNDQVVTRTQAGTTTRQRPRYRYPKVAAVQQGNDRLRRASEIWNTFTTAEAEAWRDYAKASSRRDPVTLELYAPSAQNIFLGLTVKLLQISDFRFQISDRGVGREISDFRLGEVPRMPPTSDFLGDNLTVSAEAIEGGVRFTPSSPNSEGVLTELMFQRLPNPRRAPVKFYKSLAFVAFEGPTDIDLEPGIYYFGYRFVNATTGQMTEMLGLGAVVVV